MKKYIEQFKKMGIAQKMDIVVTILVLIVSIIVVILDLSGLYKMDNNILLSLVLTLLCGIVVICLLNEFDIFADTKQNIGDLGSLINNIQTDTDQIKQILKDADSTRNVIKSRREIETQIDLQQVWEGADEICLLAIANTGFLRGNGISRIKEAVSKGVQFKMISLDPDFSTLKEYEESGIISETSLPVYENVKSYIRNCQPHNRRRNSSNEFGKKLNFD